MIKFFLPKINVFRHHLFLFDHEQLSWHFPSPPVFSQQRPETKNIELQKLQFSKNVLNIISYLSFLSLLFTENQFCHLTAVIVRSISIWWSVSSSVKFHCQTFVKNLQKNLVIKNRPFHEGRSNTTKKKPSQAVKMSQKNHVKCLTLLLYKKFQKMPHKANHCQQLSLK